MISNRRTLTYVAIALIVGAALALAVAVARGDAPAPGKSGSAALQGQTQGYLLGDTCGAADIASADPAKAEPPLDLFTAKDPFIPLAVGTPSPSPTSTPSTTLGARVKVDGTSYSVLKGDKVPSGSPAFTISDITSGDVTFTVIDGKLENGDAAISVNLGETVSATLDNGDSYDLSVLSIGAGSGGGADGHTISVLSITSGNGTAMVTLEVDGKTYSDKTVGAVISTSWGEIKIIAINVDAQTVTIMHGDQTLTLRAGQVVVK